MVRVIPSRLRSFHGHSNGHDDPDKPRSRGTSPAPGPHGSAGPHGAGSLVLRATVVRGRDLAAKDRGGVSDPYLVLTLGDARHSTVTIPKTLNPEWNETIDLPISGQDSLLLEVECWDRDRFGRDYMGEFDVALEEVFSSTAAAQPMWFPLQSRKSGKKKSVVTGEVLLGLGLHDPQHPHASPAALQQKLMLIVGAATPGLDDDGVDPLEKTDSYEDLEGDGDVTEEEQAAETPERRRRRLRLRRLRRKAQKRSYEFSGSSELAGVLFLEIVKVIDLPPEKNLTRTTFDMDPFVVTSLGKRTYKTRIINHNLNPVFEEKLVFNVMKYETRYSLNFAVVDRDKFSGNDFIGTVDFPLDNITCLAPDPNPETGIYPLREFQTLPALEPRKSRLRLPLSRSTSANNLVRASGSNNKPALQQSTSTNQVLSIPSSRSEASTAPTSGQSEDNNYHSTTSVTDAISAKSLPDPNAHDDPDLKTFQLPLKLKNSERWEDKHHPILTIRAKYMPYRALRQSFWRAMLRQYDADDSGYMSRVELTTMLDTLGSTLHESTINGLFELYSSDSEHSELSIDNAVIALEDLLQQFEEQGTFWMSKKATPKVSQGLSSVHDSGEDLSRTESSTSVVGVPLQIVESPSDTDAEPQYISKTSTNESQVMPALTGDPLDAVNLADEREEERVVQILECPICHQPRLSKKTDADIITHIATCASQDWRKVNNFVMAGFVTSSQAQRKWYSNIVQKIGYGSYNLGSNSANIFVQDRVTGRINEEKMSVYVRLGIRLFYKGLKSSNMEGKRIRKLLRSMSFKQGRKFDDPSSVADIPRFINFHQLDMSEVLLPIDQFKNFNEFFYRKLKPDARPCSAPNRPEIITSPADCRTVVFNKLDEAQKIWVKGRDFTVERLLGTAYPNEAKRYKGGALGVFRLAPQDYHRFHVPIDGVMEEPKLIEGEYYTVNPMAVRSTLDVYGENIRVIVPIKSTNHGRVMVVCVGAMMVGSTVITRKKGEHVKRAEELGYFKFGGSTLLLLFEHGRMVFDDDLLHNSSSALETLIKVGMSIGHSPESGPHIPDQPKRPENVTKADIEEARRRISGAADMDKDHSFKSMKMGMKTQLQ